MDAEQMAKPQGRIFIHEKRIVFDAEPHIMSRVRKFLDHSPWYTQAGRFTHKPISLPLNNSSAKDLLWLSERYPLEIEEIDHSKLDRMAKQYDAILAATSEADKDTSYRESQYALKLALPLKDYQNGGRNMMMKVKRMLLADAMGVGKTPQAVSLFCEPHARPGLVIVPTHLCSQWKAELGKFLPDCKVHLIKGDKKKALPEADVYISSYTRMGGWQDVIFTKDRRFRTVVMDEVHELRRIETQKRSSALVASQGADVCVGLSGTPIYNLGSEIWSVIDVLSPGALGDERDFKLEWCVGEQVKEPSVLHSYLKSRGLFLRRTPEEVGMTYGEPSKNVYTLDSDLEKLKEVENIAKMLAISILSGSVRDSFESAREFDFKLRQATGVAKARPVAEFVKNLCDEGHKVLLAGWHREVYEIWLKELAAYKPAMFTGSESEAQKKKSVQAFMEDDDCKILIMSLRSGAGLNGLQLVSHNVVFGELDWSPHVMDQLIARLNREGQKKHVQAYFLTVADGADPFMVETLNLKRSQHDGLIEGAEAEAKILDAPTFEVSRVKDMAAAYLKSLGEDIPVPVKEEGLLGEVAAALRRIRVPVNSEDELQRALTDILPKMIQAEIQREVKIGKRSRLDFLIVRDSERVAIECKVTATDRKDVYRQVRRYAEEAHITSLVLFAPWAGVSSFVVEATPVVVVDYSKAAL